MGIWVDCENLYYHPKSVGKILKLGLAWVLEERASRVVLWFELHQDCEEACSFQLVDWMKSYAGSLVVDVGGRLNHVK